MHKHQKPGFIIKAGTLKLISSFNLQSKGVIKLYDAVCEISIILDEAIGLFGHCSFV